MKITRPLVSVLMPVFNSEKYLRQAIESILAQSYTNFEFIIINDGSTDNSLEIIKHYADYRVKLINNSRNEGIVYSLNRGLDCCKGKYIVRMDSDDVSYQERIEQQVCFMEENKEIGIAGTFAEIFGENYSGKQSVLPPVTKEEVKCELIFNNALAHPTVIIRADVVNKYKLKYKEYIAEDYIFWVEALKYCGIAIQPVVLLRYRISNSQLTKIISTKKEDELRQTYHFAVNEMLKNCGMKLSLNESDCIYDFNMKQLNLHEINIIKKCFDNILNANSKFGYFEQSALKHIMGKKWLNYLIELLPKSSKMLLSKYTFYALKYVCIKKLKL